MLELNCFQNFLSKCSFREIIFGLTNIRCLFIRVIYLWSTVIFLLWHLSAKSSQHLHIRLIFFKGVIMRKLNPITALYLKILEFISFLLIEVGGKIDEKFSPRHLTHDEKKNLSSSCLQTASVLGKSQCFPSSLTMISNATFKPNHFLLPQTSRNSQPHPDRAGRKTGPTFLPSAALVGVSTAPSPATFTMAAGRSTL